MVSRFLDLISNYSNIKTKGALISLTFR